MLQLIQTADGSNTIFNSEIGENYHSKHGALQESQHVFLKFGLQYFLSVKEASHFFHNFDTEKINKAMNYGPINIDPETMGGTPVFTGTRIPVQTLFDYIEGGDDLNEFLDDFPTISKEAAVEVLNMAKKTLTTEKTLNENFA